jgi:hypothetical protein
MVKVPLPEQRSDAIVSQKGIALQFPESEFRVRSPKKPLHSTGNPMYYIYRHLSRQLDIQIT